MSTGGAVPIRALETGLTAQWANVKLQEMSQFNVLEKSGHTLSGFLRKTDQVLSGFGLCLDQTQIWHIRFELHSLVLQSANPPRSVIVCHDHSDVTDWVEKLGHVQGALIIQDRVFSSFLDGLLLHCKHFQDVFYSTHTKKKRNNPPMFSFIDYWAKVFFGLAPD